MSYKKYDPDLFRDCGESGYLTAQYKKVEFTSCMGDVDPCAYRLAFPNGWGASVVRHGFSYGGTIGLFELTVLDSNGLNYESGVTSDVEGNLTPNRVRELLEKIRNLPPTDHKFIISDEEAS